VSDTDTVTCRTQIRLIREVFVLHTVNFPLFKKYNYLINIVSVQKEVAVMINEHCKKLKFANKEL
jgi:hypothetical protein